MGFVPGQLYDILGQICVQKPKEKLPDCIAKAIAYINANFKNNTICIDDICREAGVSATYLRTLFQKHFGKRPTEYIINLRLEHARNLIACGTSVKEAAFESGFNDPKYFARVVKKHFHCTPGELQLYGKKTTNKKTARFTGKNGSKSCCFSVFSFLLLLKIFQHMAYSGSTSPMMPPSVTRIFNVPQQYTLALLHTCRYDAENAFLLVFCLYIF